MEITNGSSSCSTGQFSTALLGQLVSTLLLAQCRLHHVYPKDRSDDHLDLYDFIVVGSGSAGSPLAAKLAENPKWNVLVVEAGQDPTLDSNTPMMLFKNQHTSADWQYFTTPQTKTCKAFNNHQCYWPRGKVLGGSSSINAMMYQTGNQRDYNEWECLTGSPDWTWKSVQATLLHEMESKIRPEATVHDDTDPMEHEFERMREIILTAAQHLGYPETKNAIQKSQSFVGYFRTLLTIKNATRNNAARIYLSSYTAPSSNLHILKNALVTKVLIDPSTSKAYGVEIYHKNQTIRINASKEIILSAGTINTPQILILSGIGPKSHLEALNIPLIQDLPVGENLKDHSSTLFPIQIRPSKKFQINPHQFEEEYYKYLIHSKGVFGTIGVMDLLGFINTSNKRSPYANIAFYSPYHTPQSPNLLAQLQGFTFNETHIKRMTEANTQNAIILMSMVLLKPKSKGTVKLRSTNPFDPPLIDPNTNSNQEDVKYLVQGVRHLQRMLRTKSFKSAGAELLRFDLPECDRSFRYDSDGYWGCFVEYFTTTLYHPVGTAAMGKGADSVLDPELKVRGVEGLRVADGSVMPEIVGANTNAPIMMIGAKAAEIIKRNYSL